MLKESEIYIYWRVNAEGRVVRALVTVDPHRDLGGAELSSGRTFTEWGQDPERTAVGTWLAIEAQGFASDCARRQALQQFAQVQECGWARAQLSRMNAERERDGDQEAG